MRFRFTIRDLLWLTVVAALAVGWWLEHRREQAAWVEEMEDQDMVVLIQRSTNTQHVIPLHD